MVRLPHLDKIAHQLLEDATRHLKVRSTALERAHFRDVWTLANGVVGLLADPEIHALLTQRLAPQPPVLEDHDDPEDRSRSLPLLRIAAVN